MRYAERREYMRAYQRQWIADRRAAWFADKECAQCGSTERLELDHIDRTAKVANSIWSWSAKRRDAEVAKCQVLCHECHARKSATESLRAMRHPRSLLTTEQVREIRRRAEAGESQTALGHEFGVDRRYVWDVVHRKSRIYE